MDKQTILAIVNKLPQEIELDELVERLLLIEKIDKAREEGRRGETLSQDEVEQRVQQWFR